MEKKLVKNLHNSKIIRTFAVELKNNRDMKKLDKRVDKIMMIASWTHLSEGERKKRIEDVLSEVYDLGHCDGYAEGMEEGYHQGFEDGW